MHLFSSYVLQVIISISTSALFEDFVKLDYTLVDIKGGGPTN